MRWRTTLRRRGDRGRMSTSVVTATVLGAGAAVAAWPNVWLPISVFAAAVAVSVKPLLDAFTQSTDNKRETARIVRQNTQESLISCSTLPLVKDVALGALRCHAAVIDVPFIERDVADRLQRSLRSGNPVLIVGASMVGKTRLAAEVVRYMYPDWPILIPESKDSLANLDSADVPIAETVIWLDDIDRFLAVDGITRGGLQRLTQTGNKLIATIRATQYDTYMPSNDIRPLQWDVLTTFERYHLERQLSASEHRRLNAAVLNEKIRSRIADVGVGEYVGAAEHIQHQLQLGASVNQIGYSLVLAAVDWHRMGLARPIELAALMMLAENRLSTKSRTQLMDDERLKAGLIWATREINPTVSLLQRYDVDRFAAFDFVIDTLNAESSAVPERSWDIALNEANDFELMAVALSASNAQLEEVEEKALRRGATSPDDRVRYLSKYSLGRICLERGDEASAENFYWEAIHAGIVSDISTMTLLSLGGLFTKQGRLGEAWEVLKLASETPLTDGLSGGRYIEALSMALIVLGQAAEKTSMSFAADVYKRVLRHEEAKAAPIAATFLGQILQDEGKSEESLPYFQKGLDSRDPTVVDLAVSGLTQALTSQGRLEEASRVLEHALQSQPSVTVWKCLVIFAGDAQKADNGSMMQWALEKAILSENVSIVPISALLLNSQTLGRAELTSAALEVLKRAQLSPDSFVAATALFGQAGHEARRGDIDTARALFEQTIEVGDASIKPLALSALKKLCGPEPVGLDSISAVDDTDGD